LAILRDDQESIEKWIRKWKSFDNLEIGEREFLQIKISADEMLSSQIGIASKIKNKVLQKIECLRFKISPNSYI
jgi:hypothetical protein